MTPRKPGRIFWATTYAADVFKPGTGKHRINARLQETYASTRELEEKNTALTSEVKYLRGELYRVTGEHRMFLVQDEMNRALGVPEEKLPTGSDAEKKSFLSYNPLAIPGVMAKARLA